MTRTMTAVALLLAVAAAPATSQARFDRGNVGLPPSTPGFEPGDPPPPPPPPPPLSIQSVGVDFIEISVRPPAGRVSQLVKQAPGGAFVPFGSVTPGVNAVVRDPNLGVGKEYCYRITVLGGTAGPDQSTTRCATTDWRVGFEGAGISAAESARVLRLFDWRDTETLAEGTEDEPALYHMNVLVEGSDPLTEQGLRTMGMHVQAQPIFEQELDGWDDGQAVARPCNSDVGPVITQVASAATAARVRDVGVARPTSGCVPIGRWLFAAVPGRIYNEIRDRMLEQIGRGEAPGIRALVFRRVPVAAALAPGVSRHVLNYQYLGEQGFDFNAIQRCFVQDGTTFCQTQQEILGWLTRKIVHWVVEIGDRIVEGVRATIGRIKRLIKGEVRLDLNFNLLNTDPAFGSGEIMRSGWSGEPLYLEHVKVEVRQGLAAFYGETDDQGYVTLFVAKNSDTKVCIQVENDTAELTEYLIEKTICVANLGSLSDYTRRTIDVQHPYLNALAGMTDARRYMQRIAGFEMPKITVLVGSQADELAVAGRSFTPCMGRRPGLLGLGADLLGALGSLLNPAFLLATTATEFFYSVDMILRTDQDDSRGVPVHEYGHAVMCEMLAKQGLDAFEMAWTDVIISTASQAPDSQASYLNEAFADFLTEQIVGGTNYFSPSASFDSMDVHYCPAGATCFDENFGSEATFSDQVARIASILHDAFDGNPQGLGPNDGSDWQQLASGAPLTYVGSADSDLKDEGVRLPGTDLITLFEHWDDRGQLLREDNFLGGLADLLKAKGISESDVCALFALHDPSATCPDFVARRSWLDWLDDASAATLGSFAAMPAPAPAPGGAAVRGTAVAGAIALRPAVPAPGEAPCADCAPLVVMDGVQRIAISGLAGERRETAFAFRLGDGSFKAIDPLGQLLQGTWRAVNDAGSKLRLRPAAESARALANLIGESLKDAGVDARSLRIAARAKIDLKLRKGEALVGSVVVPFEVEVGGQTLPGKYVAKLRGA
ncbi:MAG TPA: hypothetical protein VFD92_06460 [Candidatus Binatia bacterium]|nr:hypothetical protein [Candidatus Binatia bacterium]